MVIKPLIDSGARRFSRLHTPAVDSLPDDLLDLSNLVPKVKGCVEVERGGAGG